MTSALSAAVQADPPAGLPRLLGPRGTGPDDLGPAPVLDAAHLVDLIDEAGLTGRGGAGFPTAVKLRALMGRRSPVLVANGVEGEPLSRKDGYLLSLAPHVVLDGLTVLARALGAREAHVVVSGRDLADKVESAARRLNAFGRRRGGPDIAVTVSPPGFVHGEETAVVSRLNEGRGLPADRLVRVYERGVRGRPTLVGNVETLADVALIARFGAAWFRSVGTAEEPGTMLTTVSGAVASPGVFEVPIGAPLASLLEAAGARSLQAVLVGGFHGAWVPARDIPDVPLSRAGLRRHGASPGAGVVLALGSEECGLAYASKIAGYLAGESARQCGPCVNGLPTMARTLDRLARGDRDPGLVPEVGRLELLVQGRGACSHPDGTARFVRSSMAVFADEVALHLRGGCSAPASR